MMIDDDSIDHWWWILNSQDLGAEVVKDTLAVRPELFKLGNPWLFLNILQQNDALPVVVKPFIFSQSL